MQKKNKEKPILFKSKEECCGCSACEAICPVGAISMVLDEEGFYYPIVSDKCICCYECLSVCVFSKEMFP